MNVNAIPDEVVKQRMERDINRIMWWRKFFFMLFIAVSFPFVYSLI